MNGFTQVEVRPGLYSDWDKFVRSFGDVAEVVHIEEIEEIGLVEWFQVEFEHGDIIEFRLAPDMAKDWRMR